MTTTDAPIRFGRATARGHRTKLDHPLPPTLTAMPELREPVADHARLAERVARAREAATVAALELVEAERGDEQRRVDAALAGRSVPSARKSIAARAKVEETAAEVKTLDAALALSADQLLALALAQVPQAVEQAREEQASALARAMDLFAAADRELERTQELAGELGWLVARRAGERNVAPFRAIGADPELGQVRGRIRSELVGLVERRDAAERERQRVAAWEAEHADEWARRETEARERAERSRVVIDTENWKVEPLPALRPVSARRASSATPAAYSAAAPPRGRRWTCSGRRQNPLRCSRGGCGPIKLGFACMRVPDLQLLEPEAAPAIPTVLVGSRALELWSISVAIPRERRPRGPRLLQPVGLGRCRCFPASTTTPRAFVKP